MSTCSQLRNRWLIFFFNDTATTEIYTLSLHDALPISRCGRKTGVRCEGAGLGWLFLGWKRRRRGLQLRVAARSQRVVSEERNRRAAQADRSERASPRGEADRRGGIVHVPKQRQ